MSLSKFKLTYQKEDGVNVKDLLDACPNIVKISSTFEPMGRITSLFECDRLGCFDRFTRLLPASLNLSYMLTGLYDDKVTAPSNVNIIEDNSETVPLDTSVLQSNPCPPPKPEEATAILKDIVILYDGLEDCIEDMRDILQGVLETRIGAARQLLKELEG